MHPGLMREAKSTTEEPGLVSGRFLSDLFRSLERHNVPATQLLGDLPISVDETGRVTRSVEWTDFAAFMKRLENFVDGPEGLEACGERIAELRPARTLQSLVGFSASPYLLYRAASHWALRRALPGLETTVEELQPNQLEARIRIKDGLRPCPQLFHFATGVTRGLPRILGMPDAVVIAEVGDFEARYQITVPPSRTLWARISRVFQTLFSAGSVLQFLEAQQLELHAKHEALQKSHNALAESERQYRAMTDTAVDVLCELNDQGQVVYVSPSVEELLGYSPEQVTGSHFSLWLPADCRDDAKKRFSAYISEPSEHAITLERLKLQTDSGGPIVGEISLRSYRTPQGEVRLVGILRDETDRSARRSRVKTQLEGDSLNAPRSTVEELRHSGSEHPIQRSLAVLLAALESNPTGHEGHSSDSMVAATDRMTRIVESAMIPTGDPSLSFRWLETQKLLDMVHFEFHGILNTPELELRIDVSNAPPLVWGEEALLAVALGSLFDWAIERARGPAEITLEVQTAGDPMSNDAVVVFSVSSSSSTSGDQPVNSERNEDESAFEARVNLALATAEDAVCALGGNLDHPEESASRPVLRIRLPQPLRG